MSERRHEIANITLRYVRDEAWRARDRKDYYPWCRGKKHTGESRGGGNATVVYPHWNVRYHYKTHSVRGGNQSFYWCDECLPDKYRKVADSMMRGGTTARIIQGKALEKIVAPERARRAASGGDRVPFGDLL